MAAAWKSFLSALIGCGVPARCWRVWADSARGHRFQVKYSRTGRTQNIVPRNPFPIPAARQPHLSFEYQRIHIHIYTFRLATGLGSFGFQPASIQGPTHFNHRVGRQIVCGASLPHLLLELPFPSCRGHYRSAAEAQTHPNYRVRSQENSLPLHDNLSLFKNLPPTLGVL